MCLWIVTFCICTLFIKHWGLIAGLTFLVKSNSSVLSGLKLTSQYCDQIWNFSKSVFIKSADGIGSSTIRYREVSSANRRMHEPISLTISLIYIKNIRGPRIDAWGTPARTLLKSETPSSNTFVQLFEICLKDNSYGMPGLAPLMNALF